MAISHVDTNTDTTANGTGVTATKPTGTAEDDVLIAVFTSNSQNATPPSGWTEIIDETVEVFRNQTFYKVAGGSEPSNYTFSVGSAAPLVLTISAFRGCDASDPIDIAPVTATALTSSEPRTTPGVTGGTSGRLLYLRTVRDDSSTPVTFTASATELVDVGVFSGGSVSYSIGFYMASSDYSTSGSKSGLAITASASETHNITATLGIRASAIPGTMEVSLPSIPSATMAGSVSVPGALDADLPLPDFDGEIFYGDVGGEVDTELPQLDVDAAGTINPTGTLDTTILPLLEFHGETRLFSENVVAVEREQRWLVITQDGYRNGIRVVTDILLRFNLPLLTVQFKSGSPVPVISVEASAFGATTTNTTLAPVDAASTSATANDATTTGTVFASAGTASVSVTANDATTTGTDFVAAGAISASVTVNDAAVPAVPSAGAAASASVTANDATTTGTVSADAGTVTTSVMANGATTTGTVSADAGTASASVTANDATASALPGAAGSSATVTANNATTTGVIFVDAGTALVSAAASDATASALPDAGAASASVMANDATATGTTLVDAGTVSVSVAANNAVALGVNEGDATPAFVSATAHNATTANESLSPAGTVSVAATANDATTTGTVLVDAGTLSASVVANQPTVSAIDGVTVLAGHASVTCHN